MTYGDESGTGHRNDRQRSGPEQTRTGAGKGSRYVDGSALGRNTSGPPETGDSGGGCGWDGLWIPS